MLFSSFPLEHRAFLRALGSMSGAAPLARSLSLQQRIFSQEHGSESYETFQPGSWLVLRRMVGLSA